jgi:hypothetical protein
VICTSDQGSHFSSPHSLHVLRDAQVHMSMERKGPALDTRFTEESSSYTCLFSCLDKWVHLSNVKDETEQMFHRCVEHTGCERVGPSKNLVTTM